MQRALLWLQQSDNGFALMIPLVSPILAINLIGFFG